MNFLPIAINIENKKILVVGGGKVALQKAKILSQYTNNLTFLAVEFLPELLESFGSCNFIKEKYKKKYLKDFYIVYACTNDEKINKKISKDARKLSILVNICDRPEISDFVSPAIFKKENISIAVTSNATDVKKSVAIRNKIKEFLENAGL